MGKGSYNSLSFWPIKIVRLEQIASKQTSRNQDESAVNFAAD
ncbi:hypothetical protein [Metabacillus bambusae]|nr:hypothetical protein [Metabacillus bambusae]